MRMLININLCQNLPNRERVEFYLVLTQNTHSVTFNHWFWNLLSQDGYLTRWKLKNESCNPRTAHTQHGHWHVDIPIIIWENGIIHMCRCRVIVGFKLCNLQTIFWLNKRSRIYEEHTRKPDMTRTMIWENDIIQCNHRYCVGVGIGRRCMSDTRTHT
jgi:hypothetical protein